MALPEIANPTIAQLHEIVNTNIANDVVGGIDPTDDRAVRNSIINYLNSLGAIQTPRFQGIIYNINVGEDNTHVSTHKSSVTDTVVVTRDNIFAGGQGSIFKITGMTGFDSTLDYVVDALMWSNTTNKAQLDLENEVEFLVSKISASEFWITFREPSNNTQSLGVNWSVKAY